MRLECESAVRGGATSDTGARLGGLAVVAAAAVVLAVAWPRVWLVLPMDASFVLVLLLGAAGWGAWPAAWLGRAQSGGRQVCLALALGIGILSTAALALGVAGLLSRTIVWSILAAGGLLGLARLKRLGNLGGIGKTMAMAGAPTDAPAWVVAKILVLLPLCVPLAIVLYTACLPPGLLWSGEGRGYDVLEYHLQVPREYFDAGRIQFLPHNVYASFPLGVEMLYLLLTYLAGGPLAAAIPAQLLHAALGGLTLAALLAWTPRGWPRVLVTLVAGTTVWLAYLGSLAYVELGMLFYAAVAAGMLISALGDAIPHQNGPTACHAGRATLAAGLCAGLAAGCKYTGLVLVVASLGVAWIIATPGTPRKRLLRLGIYALGAVLAFSPWLIRNAAFTGNPVYPFAYATFGGRDWTADQAEQWRRGHALPAESAAIGERTQIAFDELFNSGMFNAALWALPIGGAVVCAIARRRVQTQTPPETRDSSGANGFLVLWAALVILGWAAFTRMPGRFAVPVIAPLALLLGRIVRRAANAQSRLALASLIGFSLAGALLSDVKLAGLLQAENSLWQRLTATPLAEMIDRADVQRDTNPINTTVPACGYVWLIGDARAFYLTPRYHYTVTFDRDPWLEFAARSDPAAAVGWLRTQGVTHVVFSWIEIERLRRSYGFAALVTPAWVDELTKHGLKLASRESGANGAIFEVYEVAPE